MLMGDGEEPRRENRDKAALLVEQRFRHVDPDQPGMDELRRLALPRLEADPRLTTLCGKLKPFTRPEADGEAEIPIADPLDPMDVVGRDIKLFSLPQIVFELQKIINTPTSSSADLARVISLDTGLSAFLLRMVNSALYSFPSRIDTITRAVTVIGTKQISILALGTSILKLFQNQKIPGDLFSMEQFWRHSVACAIVARSLATRLNLPTPERLFVAGLLHDIGRLAIFSSLPDHSEAVLRMGFEKGLPLTEAERHVLGFDHSRLGAILIRKWNLPFSLTAAILHHHNPAGCEKHLEPGIVHVADVVVKGLGFGATPVFFVPPLDPGAWRRMNLGRGDLERLAAELDDQFEETLALVLPATGS